MKWKQRLINTGVILLFLFSFYMVQFGPYSSANVEAHNGGFGTFDMKPYTPELMNTVLSGMDEAAFMAEYQYYACDAFFIVMLFAFQMVIAGAAFKNWKILYYLLFATAALRGIMDTLENTLLQIGIKSFPNINSTMISICSVVTQIKLFMIGSWMVILLLGGVIVLIIKCFKKK